MGESRGTDGWKSRYGWVQWHVHVDSYIRSCHCAVKCTRIDLNVYFDSGDGHIASTVKSDSLPHKDWTLYVLQAQASSGTISYWKFKEPTSPHCQLRAALSIVDYFFAYCRLPTAYWYEGVSITQSLLSKAALQVMMKMVGLFFKLSDRIFNFKHQTLNIKP
jgi:hypothetical protein